MIILDIRTWYNFCGLDCQKGKKEKKNLQVLWDVFLTLWTLWGLGCDNQRILMDLSLLKNGEMGMRFLKLKHLCRVWFQSSEIAHIRKPKNFSCKKQKIFNIYSQTINAKIYNSSQQSVCKDTLENLKWRRLHLWTSSSFCFWDNSTVGGGGNLNPGCVH